LGAISIVASASTNTAGGAVSLDGDFDLSGGLDSGSSRGLDLNSLGAGEESAAGNRCLLEHLYSYLFCLKVLLFCISLFGTYIYSVRN